MHFGFGFQKAAWIAIASILAISYGVFFYVQQINEDSIRQGIFESYRDRQLDVTGNLARDIGSDLVLITAKLETLASSELLQNGDDYFDGRIPALMEKSYAGVSRFGDSLLLIDRDGTIRQNIVPEGEDPHIGSDLSGAAWVQETRSTRARVFSDGFYGLDGKYRIAITCPIIQPQTGEYLGTLVLSADAEKFFSTYGNTRDLNSPYLLVIDGKGDYLVTPPIGNLIGKNVFSDEAQQFLQGLEVINEHRRQLLAGQTSYATYDFRLGERLNVASPVFVEGKPEYFLEVITPTAAIYSSVNERLYFSNIQSFTLLAGLSVAVLLLIVFLTRVNRILDQAVTTRTGELKSANENLKGLNDQLLATNDMLAANEKVQKEFINVAAHELRTPITPLLVTAEDVQSSSQGDEVRLTKEQFNIIVRNSQRLKHLVDDILDVSRIENNNLTMNKERVNLRDLVSDAIADMATQIANQDKVVIMLEEKSTGLIVDADKERIKQVLANLLGNAIKFTKEGTIAVIVDRENDNGVVTVRDDGKGIDPEILPRLFTKFATKSEKGIGLGLYISKRIVEAHGGKIVGENNREGTGAAFTFTVPLTKS